MKFPLSDADADAITDVPEVGAMTDDELRLSIKSAQFSLNENQVFLEAALAEQRRRAGPEAVMGFAYVTKDGQIDPATVGGTEQAMMVNALWCHGRTAVTNTSGHETIHAAFGGMCARIGGKMIKVKITEVPGA